MRSIANHAFSLRKKFGKECVETNSAENLFYPGFRLLESDRTEEVFDEIRDLVVGDILHNQQDLIFQRIRPQLLASEKKIWRSAVLDRCPEEHSSLVGGTGEDKIALVAQYSAKEIKRPWESLNETMRALALVLRGILSHEVLLVALQKRWRVDFGAHPTRENYQMSVPFRAKDVASDRTEFGHPDIAVLLTISHYYQSGLSKQQLKDVFFCLEQSITESEAKALYREWVDSCPVRDQYLNQLQTWEAVNLSDVELFEQNLFPAFASHMDVINFWLFKMILPKQAKQFPQKVVATPWDLCREVRSAGGGGAGNILISKAMNHAVTTGFSGTDDLQFVLPLTIKQENLVSLEQTNGIQMRSLLRPENDHYRWLRQDNTALEILDLIAPEPSVGAEDDGGSPGISPEDGGESDVVPGMIHTFSPKVIFVPSPPFPRIFPCNSPTHL